MTLKVDQARLVSIAGPDVLLDSYPFIDSSGEQLWIPRAQLTLDQRHDLVAVLRKLAEMKKSESYALRRDGLRLVK